MSLEEKSPESFGQKSGEETQHVDENNPLDEIARTAIAEAQRVISKEATPEELTGVIQRAISDFTELRERYKQKSGEIRKKLDEDLYRKKKKELIQQMAEEKNPDVLLFLSQEYMKAEDEGFGAKSNAKLYESLAKYFETTARMYGTYIALDNLGNRDGLISSAFEATLSGKYWKAKCKIFPEFPLAPITPVKSYSTVKSTAIKKS